MTKNRCFSRSMRLLTPAHYESVFAHPHKKFQRAKDRTFTLLTAPNTDSDTNSEWRLGLITAKRWHKNASVRNRIRRVVREQFRLLDKPAVATNLIFMTQSSFDPMNTSFSKQVKLELSRVMPKMLDKRPPTNA